MKYVVHGSSDCVGLFRVEWHGLMTVSTFAIISVAGMLVGVTTKFGPFLSRMDSASLSVLEDRLMTQFVWSTLGVEVDSLAAFCSRRSFLEFLFLSLFDVVEDSLGVCHKLCNLTTSQCARHVIKTTTIKEEDVTFTRLILSLQH